MATQHQPRSVDEILASRRAALKNGAGSAFGNAVVAAVQRQEKMKELDDTTQELADQCQRLATNSRRLTGAKGSLSPPGHASRDANDGGSSSNHKTPSGGTSAAGSSSSLSTGSGAGNVAVDALFGEEHDEFLIILNCKCKDVRKRLRAKARYSQLAKIHSGTPECTPSFPSKKVFGHRNPDFVCRRAEEIRHYFESVLEVPEASQYWLNHPLFSTGKADSQ
eukprot:m.42977 g.42977  ORF g.42977 m.42977 type:complete len:222 (-) comp11604_c0_seq1:63-728(-)